MTPFRLTNPHPSARSMTIAREHCHQAYKILTSPVGLGVRQSSGAFPSSVAIIPAPSQSPVSFYHEPSERGAEFQIPSFLTVTCDSGP
jgi:hypothetical protein